MAKKQANKTPQVAGNETWVRLGNKGGSYPAKVSIGGGGLCTIVVSRQLEEVYHPPNPPKGFPIHIHLTKKDGLKLAAEICAKLARFIE